MTSDVLDELLAGEWVGYCDCLVVGAAEQELTVVAPRHGVDAAPVHVEGALQRQGLKKSEAVCEWE